MAQYVAAGPQPPARAGGTFVEVLGAFTWLGLTSFGGPIAHIGYFRREFVERRHWLGERAFADLVGLCQFLPGPASSKLGFSLGLLRAGYLGGLVAWAGFTLPSALLMLLFASGMGRIAGSAVGAGLLHGLQLVAVAIVAQAVIGMGRTLCPDPPRAAIGLLAAALVLLVPGGAGQCLAIVAGALLGLWLCQRAADALAEALHLPVTRAVGIACALAFALLLGASFWPQGDSVASMFSAFYQAGALVFGGGHVVLPLLDAGVVARGWTTSKAFLAGYGAAQAVPGPLFTFAAYLGAVVTRPLGGTAGAALALGAIFLPGLLLQLAALPFWSELRGHLRMQAAMRGINAAVVGVLAAALYRPVWSGSVHGGADVAVAVAGLALLLRWRVPPLLVVALSAMAGVVLS